MDKYTIHTALYLVARLTSELPEDEPGKDRLVYAIGIACDEVHKQCQSQGTDTTEQGDASE